MNRVAELEARIAELEAAAEMPPVKRPVGRPASGRVRIRYMIPREQAEWLDRNGKGEQLVRIIAAAMQRGEAC